MSDSAVGELVRRTLACALRRTWFAAVLLLILVAGNEAAFAYQVQGPTGKTQKSGGAGCTGCHGPTPPYFQNLSVTISGPSTLAPGIAGTYFVTATVFPAGAGQKMGVDIAASDTPTPLSESASNLIVEGVSGEIVHSTQSGTVPLSTTNASGMASYSFTYTMPASAVPGSTHTLYATARIGNSWGHAGNFFVTAPKAPVFTSATAATFYLGDTNTFALTANGPPPPSLSLTGTLPSGVVQAPGSGSLTLAGQPTGAELDYPLIITAANGIAPAATQNFTLSVRKSPQFISFTGPASQTYSTQTISLSATASSGLAVAFSSQTASTCSVSGTTLTMLGVGTCTIAADQSGNAVYAAAQVLWSFQINFIPQSVIFGSQQARTFITGGSFDLSPLATSTLANMAITYSSLTPTVCTASGFTVSTLSTGNCAIRASQAGTATVASAFADQLIAINPPISPSLPQLVTPRLPDAFTNVPYSANLLVSSEQSLTSIAASPLPSGIVATSNGAGSIALSGTPTIPGAFNIPITATNVNGSSQINVPLTALDTNAYSHNVVMVAAGGSHSCAVVGGGVQCWGGNSFGQLGNGVPGNLTYPAQVIAAGSGATAVSAGDLHTCAVVNGGVKCWGYNNDGRLGNGSTTQSRVPVVAIAEGSGVSAVSAGYGHTCAVVNGGVQCWGGNLFGALGVGDTATRLVPTQVIAPLSGVTDVQADRRGFTTCALISDGVQCWGFNNVGQLGRGNTMDSLTPVQTLLPGSNVTALSGSCVVRNGGVQCWGYNLNGALGDGSAVSYSTVPVQTIADSSGASAVSKSSGYGCAVVNSGVRCWGYNYDGELGIASSVNSGVPVQTYPAGSGVTAVSSGDAHSCVIVAGAVQCWGSGGSGNLGNVGASSTVTSVRQTLPAGGGASVVAASGWGDHSCAVISGGVKCWGDNTSGQLGDGTSISSFSPVQAIAAGSGVTAISTGFRHSCAIQGGSAKCWGDGGEYQLGAGGGGSTVPVQVSGLTAGVTAISAGYFHTCAVVNGGAMCWGKNAQGQLGINSQDFSITPAQVTGLAAGSGVTAIAAGEGHTCAVVNGGVQCWGNNAYYQLGVNFAGNRLTPIPVLAANSGATAVAVTSDLTCVVIGGGLRCWGSNPDLLSGDVVVMAPGSNITAVTVGRSTVCVIVTSGVQCFGLNSSGQLGIGSTTDSAIMVQTVPAGAGVTSMSAGLRHSCATVGGAVTCWGRGSAGQLGDPTVLTFGKKVFAAVQIVFAPQTITFTTLANKRNTDAPFVVFATGGASANPVVFSSQTNAICTAGGANGSVITLTGIAGTCTIAANQAGGNGYAAANEVTSSFTVSAPVLLRVLSRKTHGVAGVHDLPIEFSIPISGAISVEPRVIGTEHTLVFQFDGPVNAVSGVTAKDELAIPIGVVSAVPSGNDVVVTLTSVPDNRRAKITVPLVNGAASMASASIGFLVGDVNSSGSVTTVDTSGIKARSGSGVNSANFWFDLNASGEINASDIAAVKARVGLELP